MIVIIYPLVRQRERLRRGKLSLHASASGTRDYVTTRDIVPTLAILLLWVAYATVGGDLRKNVGSGTCGVRGYRVLFLEFILRY